MAGGQAMVEFALILPVFLLAVFGVLWLVGLAQTRDQVNSTATAVVQLVARNGGYTPVGVGGLLPILSKTAGLDPASLQLTLLTADGMSHPLGTAAAPSSQPVPVDYDSRVTVQVTYVDHTTLPLVGERPLTMGAAATMLAFAAQGTTP
jgi:hypothetical protein